MLRADLVLREFENHEPEPLSDLQIVIIAGVLTDVGHGNREDFLSLVDQLVNYRLLDIQEREHRAMLDRFFSDEYESDYVSFSSKSESSSSSKTSDVSVMGAINHKKTKDGESWQIPLRFFRKNQYTTVVIPESVASPSPTPSS